MCEKIKKTWEDLNVNILVNKRELILGLAVCTLGGLAVGILCSPKKRITIGSHNESIHYGDSADPAPDPGTDPDTDVDVVEF